MVIDKGPFADLAALKAANEAIGDVWFSKSTMSWFDSRIESRLVHGRYFLTSERNPTDPLRRYTVRRADNEGHVETLGEFYAYASKAEAKAALVAHLEPKHSARRAGR
jgi:hypothetical protein